MPCSTTAEDVTSREPRPGRRLPAALTPRPGRGPGAEALGTACCPACVARPAWEFRRVHGLPHGYSVVTDTCGRKDCRARCWIVYHVDGDVLGGYRQRVAGVVVQPGGHLDRHRVAAVLAQLDEMRDQVDIRDDLAMRLLAVAVA